ncbi:hypothetical protein Pmar_PMAR029636 [Perkinsus marinus ATCC 50983]|uniref:Uncharacterized protein n=1 Tax=Perkinsus marinus (strain ATCC 50983 / TXsc) TaxID=423536 RepID=C5KX09_PERM5|nr:hypothetical protein Pmar_PMAR029636 [Perkinsus marinus ATCC 50983]EER11013.1 hypothetical protein Pmar_PMAR029636 [Perkinsus marinus ATCC 50983]|eukprot:XP_002779218.1 hypothetical protein Pmar_PMAR029636 [Perkinsus marinus ATCC 50983]
MVDMMVKFIYYTGEAADYDSDEDDSSCEDECESDDDSEQADEGAVQKHE